MDMRSKRSVYNLEYFVECTGLAELTTTHACLVTQETTKCSKTMTKGFFESVM